MAGMSWPPSLPVTQVRIARPTDHLDKVTRFYCDGLGLALVGTFEDHDGYDGVLIALPDDGLHLELTSRAGADPSPPPSPDDLLVLYIPDAAAIDDLVQRLAGLGHHPVAPLNPYWQDRAVTIADPDGRRVVLFHGAGISSDP